MDMGYWGTRSSGPYRPLLLAPAEGIGGYCPEPTMTNSTVSRCIDGSPTVASQPARIDWRVMTLHSVLALRIRGPRGAAWPPWLKNYIFYFRMEKFIYQIISLASFMPRSRLLNEGLLRLVCSANVQNCNISNIVPNILEFEVKYC